MTMIQMVNNLLKLFNNPGHQEMQIKTALRYYSQMAILSKSDVNVEEDVLKEKTLLTVSRHAN